MKNFIPKASIGLPKIFDPENVDKEMSACTIWDVIRHTNNKPLIWNIYPFHPLTPDGRNGKPKSKDIKLGGYLRHPSHGGRTQCNFYAS